MSQIFLCLTFILSAFASCKVYGPDRLIVGVLNVKYLGGQPIPPVDVSTLLDANHTRMATLPFYDAIYIATQKTDALKFFNDTYGLNFSAGFNDIRTGSYIIPGVAAMYPYCGLPGAGRTTLDTEHPNRVGEWTFSESGWLVTSTSDGVYGGKRTGIHKFAGDIMVFTDYAFLNAKGDWSKSKNREILKGRTVNPGRQQLNGEGVFNTMSQVEVIDEKGRIGRFSDATYRNKDLDGNWVANTESVISWWKKRPVVEIPVNASTSQ